MSPRSRRVSALAEVFLHNQDPNETFSIRTRFGPKEYQKAQIEPDRGAQERPARRRFSKYRPDVLALYPYRSWRCV